MRVRQVVAAVAVTLLLGAGVASAVVVDARRPGRQPAPVPGATTSSPPAAGATTLPPAVPLDALVAELQRFVEQARGLRFKQPVKAALLDHAAFVERLESRGRVDRAQLERLTKVLRALGLLGPGVDLERVTRDTLRDAVRGFYDPRSDELVVRGATHGPAVRQVLVHELTHALQDQWFELHRPELERRDDEAPQALDALAEGDAERIDRQYLASLPPAEREAAARESAPRPLDSALPPFVAESLAFPYVVGPAFVQALLDDGGQPRLDAAFRDPPTTTEQILHPARFAAGEQAKPVTEPRADGRVFDRGVVGQFGLIQLLARTLPRDQVLAAASGWGGDRYVAWDDGSRACVRARFVMDSPTDGRELEEALRRWAAGRSGASVTGGPQPVLTACG